MIGFHVRKRHRLISNALIKQFRDLPTPNVSDVMSRLNAAGSELRPYHAGAVLCGAALTVRTRPGDNLMIHKALDMAQPGDVIVVDGGGDVSNALVGELMLARASVKKLAGIVINGAIRDSRWIRENDFPVYALGITHRGPYKDGPGEVNGTVSIGGMIVNPGDLVIGDADGVVCVPIEEAEVVLKLAQDKTNAEEKKMLDILSETNDYSWIDRELTKRGCIIDL